MMMFHSSVVTTHHTVTNADGKLSKWKRGRSSRGHAPCISCIPTIADE